MCIQMVQCYQWLLVGETGVPSVVHVGKKILGLGEKKLVEVKSVVFAKICSYIFQYTAT